MAFLRFPFETSPFKNDENDLVGASFGRGFFVLDDYSALRNVSEEQLAKEATLFPDPQSLVVPPPLSPG